MKELPRYEAFVGLNRQRPPLPPKPHPLMAQCSFCDHHWPVLFLPMELREMGSALRKAQCPKCGRGRAYILVGEDSRS